MTEVTRVPLQPIAQGALTKLWLGVLAVALAAGGLAWASMPPGVGFETVKAGTGATPKEGDLVFVKYVGKLADGGKEFDRSRSMLDNLPPGIPPGLIPDGTPFEIGQTIPGFNEALLKVQKGGKYTVEIPAAKAYGPEEKRDPQTGEVEIPANSDLVFEIEVVEIMSPEEAKRRSQLIGEIMQKAQAAGGEGGPDAEAPAKDAPKSTPKTK